MEPETEFYHSKPRADLLRVYRAALQAVRGRTVVARWLQRQQQQPLAVIALGKAAGSMMAGAADELQQHLRRGLVITKPGDTDIACLPKTRVEVIFSAHPVPDQRSLDAGSALLRFIQSGGSDEPLLFLISGGASSLVEVLQPGVSLHDLRAVNRWLLGSGLDIGQMNAVRCRLSQIKGGGLAAMLGDRRTQVLAISDVPGDDFAAIGSGLLYPSNNDLTLPLVPDWVRALLVEPGVIATRSVPHHLLAGNAQAVSAAAREARRLQYAVHVHPRPLAGDAAEQGKEKAHFLVDAPAGIHIWGGETTVRLPAAPGRGGRNQHLALAAARMIRGHAAIWMLAAGTDGSDGPTMDAGALVDGGSVKRMQSQGIDPLLALHKADSGSALEASSDLITTGATGTNVMDLLLGLKCA